MSRFITNRIAIVFFMISDDNQKFSKNKFYKGGML